MKKPPPQNATGSAPLVRRSLSDVLEGRVGCFENYAPEKHEQRAKRSSGAPPTSRGLIMLTGKVGAACSQAATRWFWADFILMRNSLGDSEAMRRKLRLKCESDWKPTS